MRTHSSCGSQKHVFESSADENHVSSQLLSVCYLFSQVSSFASLASVLRCLVANHGQPWPTPRAARSRRMAEFSHKNRPQSTKVTFIYFYALMLLSWIDHDRSIPTPSTQNLHINIQNSPATWISANRGLSGLGHPANSRSQPVPSSSYSSCRGISSWPNTGDGEWRKKNTHQNRSNWSN